MQFVRVVPAEFADESVTTSKRDGYDSGQAASKYWRSRHVDVFGINNAPVLSAITAPLFGLAVLSCHLSGVRGQSIALAQEPS